VEVVEELAEKCEASLAGGLEEEPEIATRCLERDLRALKLLLPSARDMAAVHSAETELKRVLGAVEVYAEDLPEVIANGKAQVGAGLKESLLHDAIEAKKVYDHTVKDLRTALTHPDAPEDIKNALIKAFLAGAPDDLEEQAWKLLEEQFPEIEKYARVELELYIALAEADDIAEKSVESRFLHLQAAGDEAKKLNPSLIPETLNRVEETSIALAAEQTLSKQIAEAEVVLYGEKAEAEDAPDSKPGTAAPGSARPSVDAASGQPVDSRPSTRQSVTRKSVVATPEQRGSLIVGTTTKLPDPATVRQTTGDGASSATGEGGTGMSSQAPGASTGPISADEVEKLANALKNGIISAEQSALEDAKTMIPTAEELVERLMFEAKARRKACQEVEIQKEKRQGSSKDLRVALINAREASVPAVSLEEAYQALKLMKTSFLSEDMNAALLAGEHPRAIACWFRAQALDFEELKQQNATLEDFLGTGHASDVVTVQSMMSGHRCGGSFGTATWRNNPQLTIHYHEKERKQDDHHHIIPHAAPTINVTVAIAEGGDMPATLSVHVVRNSEEAGDAGCGNLLVPGYEILASSDINDDIPMASFELTEDPLRPVFIVPSAAKSECGPFTIIVEGSNPVDVVEVPESQRNLWNYEVFQDLEWSDKMPFRKNMGGGRYRGIAPYLSWYHNPQFRVRLKSRRQVEAETASVDGIASSIVAKFPYSEGGAIASDHEDSETVTSVPTFEMADISIEICGATFADLEPIDNMDIFWTCEIKGRGVELFRTQAIKGALELAWNYSYTAKDVNCNESLVFTCFIDHSDGEEECMGMATVPFSMFSQGYIGSIGVMKEDTEESKPGRCALTTGFGAQLHLKLEPNIEEQMRSAECQKVAARKLADATVVDAGHYPDGSAKPKYGAALLQARLISTDTTQKVECAVHIVKNLEYWETTPAEANAEKKKKPKPGDPPVMMIKEERRILENPYYHTVLASSCSDDGNSKNDYIVAAEVGCVCQLFHAASVDDEGDAVFVIPSLETRLLQGKFRLELMATEDIIVERVQ
jgi:hypothetical protein